MNRPAVTSNSTDIDTCATRKAARARPCRRLGPPKPLMTPTRSTRDAAMAGATPKSAVASIATNAVKPSTRQSIGRLSASGTGTGSGAAIISCVDQDANARPPSAPAPESSRFSVSSWRIRRPRPAPIDCRIAISTWRDAARASTRFATLVQTISSISIITAISTDTKAMTGGAISTCSCDPGYTETIWRSSGGSPAAARIARPSVSRSAWARVIATPGLRRPTRCRDSESSRAPASRAGRSAVSVLSGTQKSPVSGFMTPVNHSGATPTIVNGR